MLKLLLLFSIPALPDLNVRTHFTFVFFSFQDVDQYVYGLRNNPEGRKISSISRYINMSLFVGDTVITSHVTDFFAAILPSVESAFLSKLSKATTNGTNNSDGGGGAGAMYAYDSGGTIDDENAIGALYYEIKLTPFTSFVDGKHAKHVEQRAKEYLLNHNPLCGLRWNLDATPVIGDPTCHSVSGSRATEKFTSNASNAIKSYVDLGPNVVYYEIPFRDGGILCGPGTYYEYDSNMTLECKPCPVNTYQNGALPRVESFCVPCANGTVAPEPGSSHCRVPIVVNANQIDGGIRYYGFALAGFVSTLSLGFAAAVFHHKNNRVIVAS